MTSRPSNEERNRLRLQAWEARNQGSNQSKEQTFEIVPLFGHPYKTNKEDELSNRIQKMLGSFDDNTSTEPFIVPSSSAFPLTNSLHPTSDLPYKSPKGPFANHSLSRDCNSPKCRNENESPVSSQDNLSIYFSHQKPALHNKSFAADARLLRFPHSHDVHSMEAKDSHFATSDEPQYRGSAENDSNSSDIFLPETPCSRNTSPPLNRPFSMSHSQAFNPPLSHKQTNAALTQKPTAYVRPMDGPEVVTVSPELKPSLGLATKQTDVINNKSIEGKTSSLPPLTQTGEIQCVEQILSEMTSYWPPLLSRIHSPCLPTAQLPVKITEETPQAKETGHVSSDLSHQSFSGDSERDSENGTDDPTLSNSPKSEPAAGLVHSGDWQLVKWIHMNKKNYRSKSQSAALKSLKLSSLEDDVKPSSVCVSSPSRSTVKPTPQLPSTQENPEPQNSHKSGSSIPSESPLPSESVKHHNGSVSVHFEQTSEHFTVGPKVKRHNKRGKKASVGFQHDVTTNHNQNAALKYSQHSDCSNSSKSSQSTSDHVAPTGLGKSKSKARSKEVANLLQKEKPLNGNSQDSNKDTVSLVVKINLRLLRKLPRILGSPEIHFDKGDGQHQITDNRKRDKGDQHYPKKKPKLQGNHLTLQTVRHENSKPLEATEKKSKKNDEVSQSVSTIKDCSRKSKKRTQLCDTVPHLNKEVVNCPNNPQKSCGKNIEDSTATKLPGESSGNRPLLKFEERHHPVKHYIKEAKRLKHKADAELDKFHKIFHYLHGALFFIESGIAMEREPQISMSSYTMFAETVELIKFVLKLAKSDEPSPTENDILVLCLKCQALLQMAMFHHKERTAFSYSKTLIDHFYNSKPCPPDPPSFVKGKNAPMSPTNPLFSPGSALCGSAANVNAAPSVSVVVPQDIGQLALTYVNITTLVLSAHDLWEQAEEFTIKGSGLLTELNKAMGVLNLTSTMRSMVCYIRQGLHWLQMDCSKVK